MLMADDHQSDDQIAATCGVVPRTIWRWRTLPAMQARIAEHRRLQAAAIRDEGIANRQNRLDALNQRAALLNQVIAERAASPAMRRVPGGTTGLLTKQMRGLHPVYEVDTALLAELRAIELQAAKETGQLTEKREITGRDGAPLTAQQVIVYLPENGRDRDRA